ncbi:MAG: inositol monophosphatase family protein [Myxococcota bacterium]
MSELLDAAVHIARRAGKVLVDKLNEARTVDFKGEGRVNLVTDADTASEALILSELRARFPDHAVLAEESGESGHGTHVWFVDPLDGTTNYAHGVPHFCVTLAVEGPTDGGVGLLAGVVFDPLRDECFTAERGQGAFLNGRRLEVSAVSSLGRALLCTGFPYDLHQAPEGPLGLFARIAQRAQGMRRMGSAALDLAFVAAGRFDGFFEFGLKPWDTAAGALLIQEAGGVMRRIDGAPYDPRWGDVLAAGPALLGPLSAECGAFLHSFGWKPRRYDER